jgi:hypothetical protein
MGVRLFRLLVLLVMVALAAAGEDEGARIYIYARRGSPATKWIAISSNGGPVAEVREGRYFRIDVPPGRYTLAPADGTPLVIEAVARTKSYVRLDWNYVMGRAPLPLLSTVAEGPARLEMRYLTYIDAKHVRSGAVPKRDPDPPFDLQLQRRN